MEDDIHSKKKTARIAAVIFFAVCWPTVSWQGSVLSKIIVARDAAATANNLLLHEFEFRTGILAHLFSVIPFLIMALLLYKVFKPVDQHLSRLMIIPPMMQVVIVSVFEVFNFAALMILKGEALISLDNMQRQEIAYLLIRIRGYGISTYQIYWGLWLVPLGVLLYKSGYAPRIIAILTMIGGLAYVAETCLYILLQRSDFMVLRPYIKAVVMMGLASCMLWFLIKGVSKPKPATV